MELRPLGTSQVSVFGLGCNNFGMRIDHVYVTEALAARATAAERDRDARKPSTYPGIPSDHAPIVVDFDLGM